MLFLKIEAMRIAFIDRPGSVCLYGMDFHRGRDAASRHCRSFKPSQPLMDKEMRKWQTSKQNAMVKRYTMNLCAPPADVFPLLCPVRECEWIEPWSCDMIFSGERPGRKQCRLQDRIFPPRGVKKPGSCAGIEKDQCHRNSFGWFA
jgi:hypothetical protein